MGRVKPTQEQCVRIQELRAAGAGYRLIAQELDLSRDTVRYYCKAHNLAGIAVQPESEVSPEGFCCQCGMPLPLQSDNRTRRFCSDSCRWKWWHEHNGEANRPSATRHQVVCANCGKPFLAYSSKARKYCSHACYIRDRFWRKEDGRDPYISPSKASENA